MPSPLPPNNSSPSTNSSGESGKHAAGGWPALGSSLKHIFKQAKPWRGVLSLLQVNQPKGFDCPGCAWPEPEGGHTSAFEFCENGAKAVAWEATGKKVDAAFFQKHTVSHLHQQSDHWLESQGRLTEPMTYDSASDTYRPISWDQAFSQIAQTLSELEDPNQAVFYTSGRTSNEAAFLYQLLARRFGTNNLPDCSNMCHESSGVAMSEQIGIGKGTVRLKDFEMADAIWVIGQNPGTNHPRMLTALEQAAKRGCQIVSINPLRERGLSEFTHPQNAQDMLRGRSTKISSLQIQPTIGGDLALFAGVIKYVLIAEKENPGQILDQTFIDQHTSGFDSFCNHILQTPWSTIETQSGVHRHDIAQIADIYLNATSTIACWAMGLTQHTHAVATIQMVLNLLLLKGNIGKPGAGACPVRGHSNVQGDRTMGINEKPSQAFNQKLEEVFQFTPPSDHGLSVVDTIEAMQKKQVNVFMAMGGNFASATPDTKHTIEAMRQTKLNIHVSTKLNRSHTVVRQAQNQTSFHSIILPCLGRTEQDHTSIGPQRITVEDSMSMVHASQGQNKPASPHLKSEVAIVCGIAEKLLGDTVKNTNSNQSNQLTWSKLSQNYDLIRDLIEETIAGFENFNAKINQPGGFDLGNSAADRNWQTADQKVPFIVYDIPDLTLPKDQLKLMTIRSHDQYNTTIYGLNDRYRQIKNKRNIIFMHKHDIPRMGLKIGEKAKIQSHFEDGIERIVQGFEVVAFDIPPGCCAGYFPELNALVSVNSVAKQSKTPTSKFIPVTVSPLNETSLESYFPDAKDRKDA